MVNATSLSPNVVTPSTRDERVRVSLYKDIGLLPYFDIRVADFCLFFHTPTNKIFQLYTEMTPLPHYSGDDRIPWPHWGLVLTSGSASLFVYENAGENFVKLHLPNYVTYYRVSAIRAEYIANEIKSQLASLGTVIGHPFQQQYRPSDLAYTYECTKTVWSLSSSICNVCNSPLPHDDRSLERCLNT